MLTDVRVFACISRAASFYAPRLGFRNPARAIHAVAPNPLPANPVTRPRPRHSQPLAPRGVTTMEKGKDMKAISTEKACPGN